MISHEASELQRQAALSDAPRADQCDQTCTRLGDLWLRYFVSAPDSNLSDNEEAR